MKKQKRASRKEYTATSQFKWFETPEDYNKLIENFWDALLTISLKGRVLYVNNTIKRYGFTKKDIIGKSMYKFIPKKYWLFLGKEIAKLRKGNLSRGNVEIITKKGIIVCEFASTPIKKNGKVIALQTILRDITEQKKAEENLQKEHDEMLALFNNVEDVIYVADMDTYEILFVNQFTKKAFGKELIGGICYKEFQNFKEPCEFCTNKKIRALNGKPYHWEYHNPITERDYDITDQVINWPDGRKVRFEFTRDITEQKKAEETIKGREEQYKKLYSLIRLMSDNLPDLLWVKDTEGKFLFVNKACSKILLDAKDTNEPIGKTDMYFANRMIKSHPQIPEYVSFGKKCTSSDIEVLKSKKAQRFDESGSIKGKLLSLDVYKAPFKDGNGNIIGTVGSARVVTKERQMERELLESERRYKITFESTGTAMMIIEEETTISLANHQLELLSGYSKEEIEGKMSWTKLVYKEDLEKMKKYHKERRKLKGNAPKQYEFRLVDKKGNIKNIFLIVNMIPGTKKSIASLMDITKLKKTEESLIENKEKLSQIIGGSSVPTFVINSNHIITHWNKACENLTGFSADGMIGTKKHWSPFYPKKRPVIADLIVDNILKKGLAKYYYGKYKKSVVTIGAYEAEDFFPNLSKKGKWLFFTAAPLNDLKGNIIGAIETMQDLTERKEAEEELKKLTKHLDEKVKIRTKELKKLNEELEQKVKDRTKDIQSKMEELERWNKLAVGRELKMVELKRRINKLEEKE